MSWWTFLKAVRRGEHKVSAVTWLTAAATVIYTISPIDLIPELVLPLVGFVDDLGLWGVTVMLLNREKSAWEAAASQHPRVVDV